MSAGHMHYFTLEQREALRRQMEQRAAELRQRFAASQPTTPGDLAERARETRELEYFEDALERIHGPEFGVCRDCGRDIPFARLQANPIATRCHDCQERHERGTLLSARH